MNPDEVRAFFDAHWTVRKFKDVSMPAEHLDVILHAAQRAPTDATAQMYSFVRLRDPGVRARIAELTRNPHFATASESFVVCADVHRLRRLLEARGYTYGRWPATSVHFAVGDAVMAGTNLLVASEMLGYRGCWIGGVLTALPDVVELLGLPAGVLPFAGLVIGVPDEAPVHRPRVARTLVVHEDRYHEPDAAALEGALADMAGISARGDWAQTLARYFAAGGSMEDREVLLRGVLEAQGFTHVASMDELFVRAEAAGYSDLRVRRRDGRPDERRFEAWLDRVERAERGEGRSPTEALADAVRAAESGG